jgi:hypothetical protein
MKNLSKILLICSVIFLTAAQLNAKTPPANDAAELSYIKELVDNQISFPKNFCPGEKGIVKAQITIDKNQRIKVEAINGCPGFKEYVEKQLENLIVEYPQFIGRSYICKVDFRL